jgi:hypothetical protein
MAGPRRLKHEARRRRLEEIFERGPERAAKIRAWITLFDGDKQISRKALPVDKFEENDSYILVRYEPVVPKVKITAVLLEVYDHDDAVLERRRMNVPPNFRPGFDQLRLTSPIGPRV